MGIQRSVPAIRFIRIALWLGVIATQAASCSFAEPSLVGYPCPCLDGYACVSGVCEPTEGQFAFVQESEGDFLLSIEAESFTSKTMNEGEHDWVVIERHGGSGNRALQSMPNNEVCLETNFMTQGPRADYLIDLQGDGQHFVWVRGRPPNTGSDSLWIGFGGGDILDLHWGTMNEWEWRSKPLAVSATGIQTLSVWMREDGMIIDKIVLTPNTDFDPATFANGEGPPESPRRQL